MVAVTSLEGAVPAQRARVGAGRCVPTRTQRVALVAHTSNTAPPSKDGQYERVEHDVEENRSHRATNRLSAAEPAKVRCKLVFKIVPYA